MKRTTLSLALPALLLAAAPASTQTLHLDGIAAVADSLAQAQLAAGIVPGMTIAIARNGEIILSRGYGKANVEMDVDATPQTVYPITSITKQYVAAALLRLAEAGRLSLDDSIGQHLPDYPAHGRGVTLRQLLNHTSGISPMRGTSDVQDPQWFRRDLSYAQMVELFGARPLDFAPGEKYEYNNMAYYLAGEIIARVTGMPWGAYLEREVLAPLGLRRTVHCDGRRVVPGRADTYVRDGGELQRAQFISMQVLGASGGLCSDAAEMIRWTHLLHAGQVVSPASVAEMTRRTVLSSGDTVGYGLGVYVEALEGQRKVYHGGTRPGGSFLAHYPEAGLTIAVLTNAAGVGREKATEVEEALARAIFGIAIPDLPLTAAQIAGYEGTYTLVVGERTLEVRVFGRSGALHAEPAGQDVVRLYNQGGDAFRVAEDDEVRFVFTVENGRATAVTLHQNGRATPGARKP